MEQSIQNGPSKICRREPLKILLGSFLNTLSQIYNVLNVNQVKID